MKFLAEIDIMPQKEILDPQGKAVELGLHHLGMDAIGGVRIGKHITLEIEAEARPQAEQQVQQACEKLLANVIMEEFRFQLRPAGPQ